MRKLLAIGTVTTLLLPALTFAAFNDVSLTTDTVLTVNGFTINVSGSTAVVESITVNATNFSFTLLSGSSIRVTALNGNKLSADTSTGQNANVCTNSESSLGYSAASTVTVTVEVASSICSAGGGGGGGSWTPPATPATPAIPATPASTTTPAVPATPAIPATSANPTIASLQAQLTMLLAQLQALQGGASVSFSRNLKVGSSGADVKALQVYLNTHGYVIASSGAGSPGNETTRFGGLTKAALIKLQKAAGISPAVGFFGAITRAYVNSHQ